MTNRLQNPIAAFLRRHAGFFALAVVAMSIPAYMGDRYYLSILAFMGTRFMMAMGLSLLVGQAGQISLGQAAFVGIGSYGSAILDHAAGDGPVAAAMVIAAVVSATIAGLVGMPRPTAEGVLPGYGDARGERDRLHPPGAIEEPDKRHRRNQRHSGPRHRRTRLERSEGLPSVVWGVALIMFRVLLNLTQSRVGRSLRALHRSEPAAQSLGVDTSYRKVQVFMIAAVFASIAGSFDAYFVHFISPESYNITFSIILITGVIIGGLGTLWGALWGTIVITVLPELLKRVNDDLTNLVFGVLLVGIMVFWRSGERSLWRWGKGLLQGRGDKPADTPEVGD